MFLLVLFLFPCCFLSKASDVSINYLVYESWTRQRSNTWWLVSDINIPLTDLYYEISTYDYYSSTYFYLKNTTKNSDIASFGYYSKTWTWKFTKDVWDLLWVYVSYSAWGWSTPTLNNLKLYGMMQKTVTKDVRVFEKNWLWESVTVYTFWRLPNWERLT